jgi:hypothetical protein
MADRELINKGPMYNAKGAVELGELSAVRYSPLDATHHARRSDKYGGQSRPHFRCCRTTMMLNPHSYPTPSTGPQLVSLLGRVCHANTNLRHLLELKWVTGSYRIGTSPTTGNSPQHSPLEMIPRRSSSLQAWSRAVEEQQQR